VHKKCLHAKGILASSIASITYLAMDEDGDSCEVTLGILRTMKPEQAHTSETRNDLSRMRNYRLAVTNDTFGGPDEVLILIRI
jgi:hypothetical protein